MNKKQVNEIVKMWEDLIEKEDLFVRKPKIDGVNVTYTLSSYPFELSINVKNNKFGINKITAVYMENVFGLVESLEIRKHKRKFKKIAKKAINKTNKKTMELENEFIRNVRKGLIERSKRGY